MNCILDTGSGRTYLSGDILHSLSSLGSDGLDCHLKLTTLLGECEREFREVVLDVDLGSGHAGHFPVLVANTLDLSLRLKNWHLLLEEFKRTGWHRFGVYRGNYGTGSSATFRSLAIGALFAGSVILCPCWSHSLL